MSTVEFITALFYEVDEQLRTIPKHPEAHLWPSEVVTLGLLHAFKGVGNRPFYRWLTRDYRALFPCLPERTRLFRLLKTHQDWTRVFLASPTVLGVIDTYGIELIHPIREGRVVSLDSVYEIRTTRACLLNPPEARDTIHLRNALWSAPSAPVVRGWWLVIRVSKRRNSLTRCAP